MPGTGDEKEGNDKVVGLEDLALRRKSLHEYVVEVLREMVLEGRLKPNERILELELSRKLNVSRTPMREALKVLAAEQLVELRPSRGAIVTAIRLDEVVEHFEVLAALDSAVGELAAQRITEAELGELESLHHDMIAHHRAGRRGKYFEINQAVHAMLAAATHNKTLMATHQQYTRRIARVRYAANFSQIRWDESVDEHQKIIVALRRRDAAALGRLMRDHMRATASSVIAAIEDEVADPKVDSR
jgi:DNA-binding GntR family transcriptional regulator